MLAYISQFYYKFIWQEATTRKREVFSSRDLNSYDNILNLCFKSYLNCNLSYELEGNSMNCKETEKLIPAFLVKELNNRELNQFLLHVEECPECMEELTIQYLVMIGSSLIEEGKSFHLKKALNELLFEARKKIQQWKIFTFISYIVEIITYIVMAIIIIVVMFV